MDLVSRLPKAILVTVVAFLFFGGTVGVVVAAGAEPLPETFQVAEPREGDRWEYEVHQLEGVDGAVEPFALGFEWGADEIVYDEAGVPTHVQPLVMLDMFSIHVDMETAEVIAWAQDYSYTFNSSQSSYVTVGDGLGGLIPNTRVGSEARTESNVTLITYERESPPCGFFTEMQGTKAPLEEDIVIHGGCAVAFTDMEEVPFRAFEMRTIQDVPTVGFEHVDGLNSTRLWYTPNIPYPVMMEYDYTISLEDLFTEEEWEALEDFIDEDGKQPIHLFTRTTMTGFQAGSLPWGETTKSLPPTLPSVDMAPVGTTGPDDSGIDHPFPLSEAFESAVADQTNTDLAEWLAENPDARIVKADHWTEDDDQETTHVWQYVLWGEDDDEYLTVKSARHVPKGGPAQDVMDATVDHWDEHDLGSDEYEDFFGFIDEAMFTNIPDTAPTVQSAFDRFETVTGEVPDTYGFDYTCLWFCYYNQGLSLGVGSETSKVTKDGEPVSGEGSVTESERRFFWFDGPEGDLSMDERTTDRRSTWSAGLLVAEGGETPQQATSPEDVQAGTSPVWAAPSPEATAGISFVAVLVGFTYWIWPAIKTVPFLGGFSRVRSDQMLENPVRARIHQIVKRQPGIHYQALVREVGKGGSVVDHHLRKLKQGGYVSIQKGQGFTCIFPEGEIDHRIMAAVPALRTKAASRVLRSVLDRPGRSVTDVAKELGIAKSTASYHVARLRKANLLEDAPKLFATPDAQKAIAYAA